MLANVMDRTKIALSASCFASGTVKRWPVDDPSGLLAAVAKADECRE